MTDKKNLLKPVFTDIQKEDVHIPSLIGNESSLETTFTSVTKRIQELKAKFNSESNKFVKQIIDLQSNIIEIDQNARSKLSSITKDIGNKILFFYEEKSGKINEQRSENLKLQQELSRLIKEKNYLQHKLRNLVSSLRSLEDFLGIESSTTFDEKFPKQNKTNVYNNY